MTNILITGGSGLIGKHLIRKLKDKRYAVAVLSRSRKQVNGITTYVWNPEKNEIEKDAIENTHCIIHLAGAGIAKKKWTPERKKEIINSRVKSAQLLFDKVKENSKQLQTFISSSAVGYYGAITTDHIFSEADPPATDFLGETCRLWEQSADQFEQLGIRTVKIRTGVVLAKKEGALERMITPVKIGIGSALGNGKQYMPWIHIDDLCTIYIKAIEDAQMKGSYNATAPEHVTNKQFMSTLAAVLKKPFFFPNVPAFAIKLLFGKMAAMILEGSRVSSDKIRSAGFTFQFPKLKDALSDLTGKI